jgi:hypothetical protein
MLIMLRRVARLAFALPFLLAVFIAQLTAEEAAKVNAGPDKVAIKGYDTVAYFTVGQPTKGLSEFEHDWQGAKWRFATAKHRDLFARDPEKYAPRFGGFCAMGLGLGMQVGADPEAWAIVDGKLYLNYDKSALEEFKKDSPSHIAKAEANWEKLVQGN